MIINFKKKTYSKERLMNILLSPIISEKATFISEKYKKVIFLVSANANKIEIKLAVELLFNVKVNSVKVLNRIGKKKRSNKILGCSKCSRRAFVGLKYNKEINFFKDII